MSTTPEAFERLLDAHRAMGSPLPAFLNAPVASDRLAATQRQLGHSLPPDVAELYGLADGVALDRWVAAHGGVPAYLLPGWDFPPLSMATDRSAELKQVATSVARTSGEPEELWRDDWLLLFTTVTTGDEHITVSTDRDRGSLWSVRWEFELPRRLELSLPKLLAAAVERFRAIGATWDGHAGMYLWDYDREEELGEFP